MEGLKSDKYTKSLPLWLANYGDCWLLYQTRNSTLYRKELASHPWPLSTESPAGKASLALGCHLGTWISGEFPRFSAQSDSLCLSCANSMVYAEPLLSPWKPGLLICAGQKVSTRAVPNQSLERRVCHGRPWWTALHVCCHNSLLGECSVSWVIPLGANSWELIPGFLWTSTHATFSLCWFCYFPSQNK